ncbi:MAG: glycosyl hydrolase, partial [Flavobacteriaceae bacterium]
RSDDGGANWTKTHEDYLDDIYYSYGYYFGEIRVDAKDKDAIYIMGVPILKSKDGGKSFISINAENVHSDHQALWVNPNKPGHLINGNDGGLNMTYDDGENWIKLNQPSVGQFYAINVDNQKPYHVYGGLQDNGVWAGPHNAREDKSWHARGKYPWEGIMGGDGMQIQIDSRNANIVYTGFQFGNYYRINRDTGNRKYIQPKHELGESPYRFNWQTPILLSPHNQDILYLGGNKLMRSMNQGDDWEAISNDLTTGGKKGNVAYGTITTISESPFKFGLIYVGSDDGYVNVTENSGGSWERISDTFPKDLWVSRVIASSHNKARVYVSLNGYRWDDFSVYIYMSDDYGSSWKNISAGIPASPVNVIKEDPDNENILYVGTDNGAFVSFNKGGNWEAFGKGLPNVAVHDIVIQSEAEDILLGTHGRSIYKADLEALHEFGEGQPSDAVVFSTQSVRSSGRWGSSFGKWGRTFEPSTTFTFFSIKDGKQTIKLFSENGTELNSISFDADRGFNYLDYDLSISEKAKKALMKENTKIDIKKAQNGNYYLPKGTYTIQLGSSKNTFEVK